MKPVGKMSGELETVLGDLAKARDEARLKAHLLSMDTRRRLADVEIEIENFEQKLSTRGDWVAEHVIATARGLLHSVTDLASRPEPEPTRVRDLMSRDPISCHADDSLCDAAQRMHDGDVGALPVIDDQGNPIGMLTDRDICMSAWASGTSLKSMSVADAMSHGAKTCRPSHTLRSAMDLMVTYQVRRLPVVADNGALVGIVSLADIARLAQAPAALSHEARAWMPSVLAGICESTVALRASPARRAS